MKELIKQYDQRFYDAYADGVSNSARIVLGRLFQVYQPFSVVDFGCGQGGWLAAAESLGATILKGFDGPWVRKGSLLSSSIDFTPVDFEKFVDLEQRFDLAMSLEVAEHLSADAAESFINLLCRASDVVLFSAAIKYQGGTNHVNEQWQSYWIDLFRSNAYECFDVFRGAIWRNEDVDWWYRQNTFLFVGRAALDSTLDVHRLRSMEQPILDAVHPSNYEPKTTPIRTMIRDLGRWLSKKRTHRKRHL